LDIDGFVFAPSAAKAMEGRQLSVEGPPSSDFGAASEEDEIGVAVALGVDPAGRDAVADALVEVQFDHAAGPGFEQEGTERTENSFSVSSVLSC
jgi:hypothetical protein